MGNDITHLILTLTFGSSDTLRGVYSLCKFTFFGLVTTTFSSFTYLPSILNQLIFLSPLFCDKSVLGGHLPIEFSLGRLLQAVFGCWQFWDFCIGCKHYLFILNSFEIVVLVDPGVFVLTFLVVFPATSITSTILTAAATTGAYLSSILSLFDVALSLIRSLASSLGTTTSTRSTNTTSSMTTSASVITATNTTSSRS